jgi:hypothetical protein
VSVVVVVRTLAELGEALTFAPERHCGTGVVGGAGDDAAREALSALVVERAERVVGEALNDAVVFDTTHARDGLLDARAALRASTPPASAKKRVRVGDLLVSRLRPYLRQIALVHPALRAECGGRPMACSTEFYVLSPRERDDAPASTRRGARSAREESLAFLLPWLLGSDAQAALAAAQEGGHHPRVPREVLLAMGIERSRVAARGETSARVERALGLAYAASRALDSALREPPP